MKPNATQLHKKLSKENACYVLITCGHPSEDGEMAVEMSYQGDFEAVSYLLQGAQSMIDEQYVETYQEEA